MTNSKLMILLDLLYSRELSVDCLYDIIEDFIVHSSFDYSDMIRHIRESIAECEEGE